MAARNEFLDVDARACGVKFSVLSASAEDDGSLRVSFEVRAKDGSCHVEMDGYLPVPDTFARRTTALELDDAQREDLVFYEYDHLPFRSAKVVFTPRRDGQIELRVDGDVVDPGDEKRVLAISVRAVARLDQVSVKPSTKREAVAVLARTGLGGEFVWTKMPNGLWTFYSPGRARSKAAFARLVPRVRSLARARVFEEAGLPVDRAALHASPPLLRRAHQALRAEVDRRWPKDVESLLPDDAASIDDLLAI